MKSRSCWTVLEYNRFGIRYYIRNTTEACRVEQPKRVLCLFTAACTTPSGVIEERVQSLAVASGAVEEVVIGLPSRLAWR